MSEEFNNLMRRPFHVGAVRLENRLVQAPMASVSGRAYRLQARRFGVGLTVTEMVSSYGVHYDNRRTTEMLELVAAEHPVAVQLFGSEPQVMAEAALVAGKAGADLIDINMGCPVRKVVKTGAGAALMREEPLAAAIVAAVVAAVRIPVTVKLRSGWGAHVSAPSLAARLVEAGAAAVCIHPRTAAQGWKGRADHELTARLAEELPVPVIASGDVTGCEEATLLLEEMGAAAVMVGRAALGNPWLYEDLLAGRPSQRPSLEKVLAELLAFSRDMETEMGAERAGRSLRKFYGWYLSPFRLPGQLRQDLRQAGSATQAVEMVRRGLS